MKPYNSQNSENYSLQAITWSPESVVLVGTMVTALSEDKRALKLRDNG